MAELDLGRIRFFDKGEYSVGAEYVLWDFVTSNGSTYLYINKVNSTGKPLTDEFYWKCLAKRGLSAFEVWDIMNGGNKTEAQFFDFIQSPANDAKNNYDTVVKPAVQAQGVYAQAQGDYAKAQGESIEDDLALKADRADLAQLESDVNHLRLNNNILINGDFAKGTDSWTVNSGFSSMTAANNILTSTITEIQSSAYVRQHFSMSSIGAKIYFTYQINPFRSHNPISRVAPNNYTYSKIATAGEFTRVSGIFTNAVASSQFFIIYNNGISAEGMLVGSQTMYKNVMFINLLDAFGEGNEPTQTEMDLLMSILGVDFFAGEITVTQRQLMNWQLKMIRQNRSAIVALGGTII